MARNNTTPTKTSKIWDDRILLYSRDDGKEQYLRIRTKRKDGTTDIATVITPLYQARFIDDLPIKVPGRGKFEPRRMELCYENPSNATKESNLTVYVPYSPGDTNWKAQIKETYDFSNALAINYNGETQTKGYINPDEDLFL